MYFGADEDMPVDRIPNPQLFSLTTAEENPDTPQTWYYIESPDGVFTYPLFAGSNEANSVDTAQGGAGSSNGYSFPDEPTSNTWYGPVTDITTSGTV
ncbi:MAG: hypothetical protein HOG94_15435, partial [Nitrospinaceae bacterium]|nr:hypothetical protein [Nitrospinaceae bacterium]